MAKTIRCLGEHHGRDFSVYNGDCVDVLKQIPDNSVDFSVYSPPVREPLCLFRIRCRHGKQHG